MKLEGSPLACCDSASNISNNGGNTDDLDDDDGGNDSNANGGRGENNKDDNMGEDDTGGGCGKEMLDVDKFSAGTCQFIVPPSNVCDALCPSNADAPYSSV